MRTTRPRRGHGAPVGLEITEPGRRRSASAALTARPDRAALQDKEMEDRKECLASSVTMPEAKRGLATRIQYVSGCLSSEAVGGPQCCVHFWSRLTYTWVALSLGLRAFRKVASVDVLRNQQPGRGALRIRYQVLHEHFRLALSNRAWNIISGKPPIRKDVRRLM